MFIASRIILAAGTAAALAIVARAPGQSSVPAIFVANNGNIEGSVSALAVNADGSLAFKQKVVTGSVPSSQQFHPGLNAYAISISPDGRFLASSHATSSSSVEQLTIFDVFDDASIAIRSTFSTPDSPLDVEWIGVDLLAVTKTSVGGANSVIVYAFDPDAPGGGTLTQVDLEATGAFTSWMVLHPSGEVLYVQDSTGAAIRAFGVDIAGELSLLQTVSTGGIYPLGLGVSPDGTWLYSGGGISGGGHVVQGWSIGDDGTLSSVAGSPFLSPGSSPKQVVVSGDGVHAYAAHGTDATIRGFAVDESTGALQDIGVTFDVGFQGSLGEIAVRGHLLFATDRDTILDGVRGVYSFTIERDGALTQNGPLVDTQGSTPNSIAIWFPPQRRLLGDLDGNGVVDGADLGLLAAAWGTTDPIADLNGDGIVDGADLGLVLGAWGDGG